jgi:uncharacterized protein with LGFP repeats
VRGAIRDTWFAFGGMASALGAPLGDERSVDGRPRQEFRGGYVTSDDTGQFRVFLRGV